MTDLLHDQMKTISETEIAEEKLLAEAKAILASEQCHHNQTEENDRGEIAWYNWIW